MPPSISACEEPKLHHAPAVIEVPDSEVEDVIPDSEEERVEDRSYEVIELSSDDNESGDVFSTHSNPMAAHSSLTAMGKPNSLSRTSNDTIIFEAPPSSSAEVSQLITTTSKASSQASISGVNLTSTPPPSTILQFNIQPPVSSRQSKKLREGIRPKVKFTPDTFPVPSHWRPNIIGTEAPRSTSAKSSEPNDQLTSTINLTTRESPRLTPNTSRSDRAKSARQSKAMSTERLRLVDYAERLFSDLTRVVFGEDLGKATSLEWSNRLTRTAGRAHYSRHMDGTTEARVELSVKVVDREERVRSTLAHELCHLAVWMIDGVYDSTHGPEWRKWVRRVKANYPNVEISPTHTYDIVYPYNWRCVQCQRTYGRYKIAIDTTKLVCRCKGELIPLHNVSTTLQLIGKEKCTEGTAIHPVKCVDNSSPQEESQLAKEQLYIDLTHDSDMEELTFGVETVGIEDDH